MKHSKKPVKMPVMAVKLIPLDRFVFIDNAIVQKEMDSLERAALVRSIAVDGITKPVVAVLIPTLGMYSIAAGHNLFEVLRDDFGCEEIPTTVIEGDTLMIGMRHHQAHGIQDINKLSLMLGIMHQKGMTETEMCQELGLEAEEVLRLLHRQGITALYTAGDYSHEWRPAHG